MDTEQLIKSGLRSVAASVPVAGSIAQAWNEYESVQLSKRVEEFFAYFSTKIDEVRSQIADVDEYVKMSGEIPILVERVVLKVQIEASEEKRRCFARVLTIASSR